MFLPKVDINTVFKIGFCFLSFKILFERQSKHLRRGALGFLVGKYRISVNKMESVVQPVILNVKRVLCIFANIFG